LYKISKYIKAGNRWYTYGNYILHREDPFNGKKILIGGRIAIVEKFRTKTRECIMLYSDNQLIGPNSFFFGVFRSKRGLLSLDGEKLKQEVFEAEKILAAWFSSTIFLALYLYNRREISGDYGRIKIGDMANFPCIDPSLVSGHNRQCIITEFEAIMRGDLPTIYDQLKTKKLQKLDKAILKAIGIKDFAMLLDNMYADLRHELDITEIIEEEIP